MKTRIALPRSSALLPQHGIALVLVLWLTALLTVIAGGFAYAMRSPYARARVTKPAATSAST